MKPQFKSQIQENLYQSIQYLPKHREKNKRTQSLNLDDLLDENRSLQSIEKQSFAWIMESYRLLIPFKNEIDAFTKKESKPATLEDLLLLSFSALMSNKKIPQAVLCSECVEFSKKYFAKNTAPFVNAFLRSVLRKEKEIKELLLSSAEYRFGADYLKDISKESTEHFLKKFNEENTLHIHAINQEAELKTIQREDLLNKEVLYQALQVESYAVAQAIHEEILKSSPVDKKLSLLDACAAPGGKAIAIGLLLKESKRDYELICTDMKYKRLLRLQENLKKWEAQVSAEAFLHEWGSEDCPQLENKEVDYIFLDLPCSGFSTIYTRPDVLTKVRDFEIDKSLALQKKILEYFLNKFKSSKIFVSLCSNHRAEQEQVERLLKKFQKKVFRGNEEITLWTLDL